MFINKQNRKRKFELTANLPQYTVFNQRLNIVY
jgi:hypothetical protein